MFSHGLTRSLEDELEWYFLRSAAEMGLSSNYWPLVQLAMYSGGSRDYSDGSIEDTMISRVEAATRYRRVNEALRRLTAKHRRTIHAAYTERVLPKALHDRLGRAAGVALISEHAKSCFRDDTKLRVKNDTLVAWLTSVCLDQSSKTTLSAIRADAITQLEEAYKAFAKAWR